MKKTFTLSKNGNELGTFNSFRAAVKASQLNAAWTKPWSTDRSDKAGDVYTAFCSEATYTIVIK
jgi:hypothetical protein